jgi:RND family efflux transporter MFP subunit
VIAKNVVGGTRVTPGDVLFEIADLSRVWVLADIYESEIPLVRPAQTARMTLAYLPGRVWTGRVSFVAPLVNPESRTVAVRLEFDNFDGTLKPEMFADVLLERSLGSVVAVPEEAVLSTGTRFLVFVDKGDGVLEPRDVEPGDRVERWWEIRRGIAPGEKVVTQANFLIDSESRLKAALAGLAPAAGDHAHAAPAPTPSGAAPRPPPPPTPGPSSHDHSGHGGAAASGDRP